MSYTNKAYFNGEIFLRRKPFTNGEYYNGIYEKMKEQLYDINFAMGAVDSEDELIKISDLKDHLENILELMEDMNMEAQTFMGLPSFYCLKIGEDGKKTIIEAISGIEKYISEMSDEELEDKYINLVEFMKESEYIGRKGTLKEKDNNERPDFGEIDLPIMVLYKSKYLTLTYDETGPDLYSNSDFEFECSGRQYNSAKDKKKLYLKVQQYLTGKNKDDVTQYWFDMSGEKTNKINLDDDSEIEK